MVSGGEIEGAFVLERPEAHGSPLIGYAFS